MEGPRERDETLAVPAVDESDALSRRQEWLAVTPDPKFVDVVRDTPPSWLAAMIAARLMAPRLGPTSTATMSAWRGSVARAITRWKAARFGSMPCVPAGVCRGDPRGRPSPSLVVARPNSVQATSDGTGQARPLVRWVTFWASGGRTRTGLDAGMLARLRLQLTVLSSRRVPRACAVTRVGHCTR